MRSVAKYFLPFSESANSGINFHFLGLLKLKFLIFASLNGKFLSSSAVVFRIDGGDAEKQGPDSAARLDWLRKKIFLSSSVG